jgi:hypothetical protein
MLDMFTTDPGTDLAAAPTGAATMFAETVPLLDGLSCPCGARTDERHTECRKCRARGRWQRRAAGRGRRPLDGVLATLALVVVGS